jgi:hypothetical protein
MTSKREPFALVELAMNFADDADVHLTQAVANDIETMQRRPLEYCCTMRPGGVVGGIEARQVF